MEHTKTDRQAAGHTEEQAASQQSSEHSENDLGRIQDILFGSHVREISAALDQLKKEMTKNMADLQAESNSRVDALAKDFRAELDAVKESLKKESTDRKQTSDKNTIEINNAISRASDELRSDIELTDKKCQESGNQLEARLGKISEQFSIKLDTVNRHVTTQLNDSMSKLRHDKMDRSSLATLLSDMASQVTESNNQQKEMKKK